MTFSPMNDFTFRTTLIEIGRIAYQRGLLTANDGNLSVRLPDGNLLITPSGLCKGRLEPEDLLVITPEGEVVEAAPGRKPTSEQPMHLEVYRLRPDVNAVLHAHPPYAVALTVAGFDLRDDFLPETRMTLGSIPTTDFALPSSPQNAAAIRTLLPHHDALMLRQHGSLTVGRTLEEALINLERLEHTAHVQYLAQTLGRIVPLPEDLIPD
ncbi:MAG: class II aldolase/adducin family protein [Anaerolineales bacterium]